jgi:hypothetical protein
LTPEVAAGLATLTETYGRALDENPEPRKRDPYDYTAEKTKHPLYA